jgi:hypothetical protein
VPWSVRATAFSRQQNLQSAGVLVHPPTIRPVRGNDCRHSGEEKFAEKHA